MKIVILLRILMTAGAQKIAINEAKVLQSMGNDVELVFLRGKKLPEYNEILKGINYKIISETGDSILSPLYQYVSHKFSPGRGSESRVDYNLIRKFPGYVKNKNIDYIICHDQLSGLGGYYSLRKLGIPYSVFIHERISYDRSSIFKRIWYYYEDKVLKNASEVFAITDKVAETVAVSHHIDAKTNYPGMDISRITKFSEKENSILAVAMWDEGRKPELYLDIIKSLTGFTLQFVGNFRSKEFEDKFKEEIKKRKLEDIVIMKQGILESELIDMFQKSKFVIRFGFGEFGLGTATIEALQNCVPLIVNSDLGSAELINSYSCGIVLKEINPSNIKMFINENNNENSYNTLQNNIIRLSNDYSWEAHSEKLLISKNNQK